MHACRIAASWREAAVLGRVFCVNRKMRLCHYLIRQRSVAGTAKSYCTKTPLIAESQNCEDTLTKRVTNIIENAKKRKRKLETETYQPRINYTGFLRNCTWNEIKSNEESTKNTENTECIKDTASENETDERPRHNLYWKKFSLLMGFSGTNYLGMQYNPNVPTIEDSLFEAMLKNNWVTEENVKKPFTVSFQRGSRTDRGVSAARQCCSLLLPKHVDIDALNRDLPDDIRVFAVQRVTPAFDARYNCEARTYSYTLPTVSFANYNDQITMADYRMPAEQLLKVNQVLQTFVGHTNFHNFTTDKQHFDRSSVRHINEMACDVPFVVDGVEFARITVKGQSFMLHQIRKMVGFSLAVIRDIIPLEMLQRALTRENFNVPTAPGLGLVLECLHFDKYNRTFGHLHGEISWEKYETEIEIFRRNHIDPVIIRTEIEDQTMVNWLDFLVNHSYDEYTSITDETFDDSWGEDPEFWKKVTK